MNYHYIVWPASSPLPKVFTPKLLADRKLSFQNDIEKILKSIEGIRIEAGGFFAADIYSPNDISGLLSKNGFRFIEINGEPTL